MISVRNGDSLIFGNSWATVAKGNTLWILLLKGGKVQKENQANGLKETGYLNKP